MEKRVIKIGKIRSTDERTVDAVLSSEYPVKRFDGDEVLSHDPDAVDLSRAPLPLIVAHEGKSLPVGIVENLQVVGRKLRGVLRFSKSADAIWQDVKDKIIRNLSIGYVIKTRKRTSDGYLATLWQPYECSLVSAGADPTAGIGRNLQFIGVEKMDKNDLLKERKKLTDDMIALAGKADLSAEDKESFDRFKDGLDALDRRIDMQADLDKVRKPAFDIVVNRDEPVELSGGPVTDRSYEGMFGKPQAYEGEVENFRTQLSNIPSGGGFAVPDPLAAKWLDAGLPSEIVRPNATVWPMTSGSLKVPGWDISTQTTNLAGFLMAWTAEAGTATAQTGILRQIQLNANKGQIYCNCSQELVDDGQGFAANLEMMLKKAVSYGLESAFLTGSGAGQPQGLTNAGSLISVGIETGQSSDSIVWENLGKMYARMYPGGRQNAVWIANSDTLPQLLTLSLSIGTGGSHINVFNEKDGKFSILGRPVLFSPHVPTLGDANDIMFVDLSQYAIGIRKDVRLERSNIPNWTEDLMSYRVIVRADGMPMWASAHTPKVGDSLSWLVGLGARA